MSFQGSAAAVADAAAVDAKDVVATAVDAAAVDGVADEQIPASPLSPVLSLLQHPQPSPGFLSFLSRLECLAMANRVLMEQPL